MSASRLPDPSTVNLAHWLSIQGTRTGTYTFGGATSTDMLEVEWRLANNDWTTVRPSSR